MMKPNVALQERMRKLYHRFQQSPLTRAAFCREGAITAAQFTYWCRLFEKESHSSVTSPEASSDFAQLHLPEPATHVISPAVSPTPLMILDMAGTGRLELYAPVEASFLKALLSQEEFINVSLILLLPLFSLSANCRYALQLLLTCRSSKK